MTPHEEDDGARVDCPICGQQYANKGGLKKHKDKFHSHMKCCVIVGLYKLDCIAEAEHQQLL